MREKKKNKNYGVLRTSIVRGTSKEREKEKSKKTTAFGNREMKTVKAYLAGDRERNEGVLGVRWRFWSLGDEKKKKKPVGENDSVFRIWKREGGSGNGNEEETDRQKGNGNIEWEKCGFLFKLCCWDR